MSIDETAIMEEFLNETIGQECLRVFEKKFLEELEVDGMVAKDAKFEYAFCLVHSRYGFDVRRAIKLFEELYATTGVDRVNFLYFAAYGHARLHNYEEGLKNCKTFLEYRENNQVRKLERYLEKRCNETRVKRYAILGGVAMIAGGILSCGMALLK